MNNNSLLSKTNGIANIIMLIAMLCLMADMEKTKSPKVTWMKKENGIFLEYLYIKMDVEAENNRLVVAMYPCSLQPMALRIEIKSIYPGS